MTFGFIFSVTVASVIGFVTSDILVAIGSFLILYYTSTQVIKSE